MSWKKVYLVEMHGSGDMHGYNDGYELSDIFEKLEDAKSRLVDLSEKVRTKFEGSDTCHLDINWDDEGTSFIVKLNGLFYEKYQITERPLL